GAVPVRVRPADPERPKVPPPRRPRPALRICDRTPAIPVGEAFQSECAPPPKSAVEQQLRADLSERLDYTADLNAIRVRRPFFDHLEVWPDIVIPELRVAIAWSLLTSFAASVAARDIVATVGRPADSRVGRGASSTATSTPSTTMAAPLTAHPTTRRDDLTAPR
ncbi:MAG: hypothetical protein ABUL47_00175, partial [Leifsonia sp.]